MGRKIRMIKENDLYDWEVGDIAFVNEDNEVSWYEDGEYRQWLPVGNLIRRGYAEWVEDEKDWDKFIDEKKAEFVESWDFGTITVDSDKRTQNFDYLDEGDLEVWQQIMMYEYVLQEYADRVNKGEAFAESGCWHGVKYLKGEWAWHFMSVHMPGSVKFATKKLAKQALIDMKPVLEKLKALKTN
jgi:hypothetical protein